MIESIGHKGLKLLWEKGDSSKLPAVQVFKINFPGANLHTLKGDLAGFWAVKVNGNYRIIFRFKNENAFDIDYIDYH